MAKSLRQSKIPICFAMFLIAIMIGSHILKNNSYAQASNTTPPHLQGQNDLDQSDIFDKTVQCQRYLSDHFDIDKNRLQ